MPIQPLGARRDGAERYLVLTIAAFAVTVAGVRWYLDLAGYPTIGGGGLHVAHVLWGGLALFIAALLPLLYVGRRSLLISAVLAGVGAGLFIDEVGKFLTTTNDYFFAPAAPIIYGSILLLILLWVLVRRRRLDNQSAMHAVVDSLADGVDGRLTEPDRERVLAQLRDAQAATTPSEENEQLAASLVAALRSPAMDSRLANPGFVARGDARRLLERFLPARLERWLIAIGLLLAVASALVSVLVLLASASGAVDWAELQTLDSGRLELPSEPLWILLFFGISTLVGVGSLLAILLLLLKRALRAMDLALAATLLGLVAGGLVGFYAAQIGALATIVQQVLLLGLILDQRVRLQRAAQTAETGAATSVDAAAG